MHYNFFDCCKSRESYKKEESNSLGTKCTTVDICQIDNGWIMVKSIVQEFSPKEGEKYEYIEPDILEKKVLYSEDKPSPKMESEDDIIKSLIDNYKKNKSSY